MKNKIKIKNTLPHILSAFFNHKDCPDGLKTALWNFLGDNSDVPADAPESLAPMLKHFRPKHPQNFEIEPETQTGDLNTLARQLSVVMKNDSMPTELFNVMADALSAEPEDWRKPEALLINLKELREREAKND